MSYIIIFLFLLLTLFFLSRFLNQKIFKFLFNFTKNRQLSVKLFALLFLPGVIIHELSHYLVAMLLMVPVGKIEFYPHIQQEGIKLGSVEIGSTDPLRRFIIGIAPLLVGVLAIILAIWYYPLLPVNESLIKKIMLFFFIFEIGNTMYSSKKDMEGAIELILTVIVLFSFLYFLGIRLPDILQENIFKSLINILKIGNVYLLVPIGIDLFLILLFKLFKI